MKIDTRNGYTQGNGDEVFDVVLTAKESKALSTHLGADFFGHVKKYAHPVEANETHYTSQVSITIRVGRDVVPVEILLPEYVSAIGAVRDILKLWKQCHDIEATAKFYAGTRGGTCITRTYLTGKASAYSITL